MEKNVTSYGLEGLENRVLCYHKINFYLQHNLNFKIPTSIYRCIEGKGCH